MEGEDKMIQVAAIKSVKIIEPVELGYEDSWRNAYGISNPEEKEIKDAQSSMIEKAETPQQFAEIYLLVHKNIYLLSALFEKIVTKDDFEKEDWEIIEKWCIKLGLKDLRTAASKFKVKLKI